MKTIKVKYVDWWNGFRPEDYRIHKILCKYYDVEISEKPDYVIASVYSKEFLKYDCIRILYTGENVCPDFNLFDYAIGFEYLSFGDRYIRLPNYLMNPRYEPDVERMLVKHKVTPEEIKEKTEFCDFIYSNGNADPIRAQIYTELNAYKKVNSGGRYMNNMGMPEGVPDKYAFQKKHKFSIAFENSSHSGYTTEKLVQSFAAQTIPIYWGDPDVTRFFNSRAMINVSDFQSLQEVVKRVSSIDNDPELYMDMLGEPAMLKPQYIQEQMAGLENFLVRIFEQPIEKASRRNSGMSVDNFYSDITKAIDIDEKSGNKKRRFWGGKNKNQKDGL